jgi:hypothetical protein
MIKKLLSLAVMLQAFFALNSQAQTTFINETFSGNELPEGWTSLVDNPDSSDGGWKVGSSSAISSQYLNIPAIDGNMAATNDDRCNCNKFDDRLISPSINLSTASNAFLSFDYFYYKAFYQGKTEKAQALISLDNGENWTELIEFSEGVNWRTAFIDLSAYIGEENVKITIRYSDNRGWLYGFGLDNFKIYEAVDYDLSAISSNIPEYAQTNQAMTIAGSLRNLGASNINELRINYQVNNGDIVSANLSDLAIEPTTVYNFTHTTPYNPTTAGLNNIKIWADELNGYADQFNSNDTITASFYVANQLVQRTVLFEQFTSNTCGPCASAAPGVNNILNANNVNTPNGKVVSIKYHQNFPAPHNDGAYTAESNARRIYYGISGIPGAVVGGNEFNGHTASLNQAMINNVYAKPTIFDIDVRSTFWNNKVNVEVDLTSHIDFTKPNTRLHVAIIENSVTRNELPGGTTNQQVFTHVSRKMLPNQLGSAIPNMATNETKTYTFSHTLNTVFSSMEGLSVIAFVQNNDGKEVLQAKSGDVVLSTNKIEAFPLTIFPNPTTGNAFVRIDNPVNERIVVNVFNLEGKKVSTKDFGKLGIGEQLLEVDNSSFPNGIYLYQIIMGDKMVTRSVSVVK